MDGYYDPANRGNPNITEAIREETSDSVIGRMSNIGGISNPMGNTAATLFYQGAKNGGKHGKYGKFLFYGIGSGQGQNEELNAEYYLSENRAFNRNISSTKSKNPTAQNLVNLSISPGENEDSLNSAILGGSSAPYNWSDFLYCKFYGKIPNNYMVTLRRYPTPMLDNLSLPNVVKETDLHKLKGAGKPVAQAITWFGGNTGNSINDIISFSTGMVWDEKSASSILNQKASDQGFSKSILGLLLAKGEEVVTGEDGIKNALISLTALASASTEEGERTMTDAKLQYWARERGTDADGPLSDYIFTSVDVIDKTYYRGAGLTFENSDISLDFHYELTSLGQVNTKASFLDLFANILSIGTNYGTFLRPDIRYDNSFPAIGFLGGDDGLRQFYAAPVTFLKTYMSSVGKDSEGIIANLSNTVQGDSEIVGSSAEFVQFSSSFYDTISNTDMTDEEAVAAGDRALRNLLSGSLMRNIQFNLSYFTGAPIGEWHLVVGNPLNPIAMIGNLICDGVDIKFGEKLGPDDFPTEFTATFNLKHGRGREKGEIESMFNRGRGRLYQSTLEVSSNAISEAKADSDTGQLQGAGALEQVIDFIKTQNSQRR